MNPFWLILIVPVSVFIGIFLVSIFSAGKIADFQMKIWHLKSEIERLQKGCAGLNKEAQQSYGEALRLARKTFNEASLSAQKTYEEATAPAQQALEKARVLAWRAYSEATLIAAQKACKEAKTPA